MWKRNSVWLIIVVIVLGGLFASFGFRPSVKSNDLSGISLPQGFKIEVFADNLGGSPVSSPGPNPGPRMMLLKEGTLFVTIPSQGRVLALRKEGERIPFIDQLDKPHGIDFHEGWFYIAEEGRVIRVRDDNNDLIADTEAREVLIDLPRGGHFTRTVKIHDNSLFLSVGSSCNVCVEEDERRAAITRCNLDGSECSVFASGLRNAVGFVFHPVTGQLYATDNGRDWLGDDLPPEEINLVERGRNYGWPLCYGKRIHDTDFDKNENPCEDTVPPFVEMQAHSAPLGLAFYTGEMFPKEYKGDLFVAYHGSWNRGVPTGYKIVRIDMDTREVSDFATGWLQGVNVLGRPVDIIVWEGDLLVSDDNAGKIYRIFYEG